MSTFCFVNSAYNNIIMSHQHKVLNYCHIDYLNQYFLPYNRLQIEESSKPARLSQQLDKAVTSNYKPVANHDYNVRHHSFILSLCSLSLVTWPALCVFFFCSGNMSGRRRRRAKEPEPTNNRCWTCCFLHLRSTSTTTSKTWWTSPNSLW